MLRQVNKCPWYRAQTGLVIPLPWEEIFYCAYSLCCLGFPVFASEQNLEQFPALLLCKNCWKIQLEVSYKNRTFQNHKELRTILATMVLEAIPLGVNKLESSTLNIINHMPSVLQIIHPKSHHKSKFRPATHQHYLHKPPYNYNRIKCW